VPASLPGRLPQSHDDANGLGSRSELHPRGIIAVESLLTFPSGVGIVPAVKVTLALHLPDPRRALLLALGATLLLCASCMAVRYRGFGIELDVEPVVSSGTNAVSAVGK
jgi:hypothetical protein